MTKVPSATRAQKIKEFAVTNNYIGLQAFLESESEPVSIEQARDDMLVLLNAGAFESSKVYSRREKRDIPWPREIDQLMAHYQSMYNVRFRHRGDLICVLWVVNMIKRKAPMPEFQRLFHLVHVGDHVMIESSLWFMYESDEFTDDQIEHFFDAIRHSDRARHDSESPCAECASFTFKSGKRDQLYERRCMRLLKYLIKHDIIVADDITNAVPEDIVSVFTELETKPNKWFVVECLCSRNHTVLEYVVSTGFDLNTVNGYMRIRSSNRIINTYMSLINEANFLSHLLAIEDPALIEKFRAIRRATQPMLVD